MIPALAGVLLLYLELGLLLAIGYAIFRAVRGLAGLGFLRLDCVGSSRLGRTVLLAVLLSPFVVHLLLAAPELLALLQPAAVENLAFGQHGVTTLPDGAGWAVEPLPRGGSWLLGWLTPALAERVITLMTVLLIGGLTMATASTTRRILHLRRLVSGAVTLRRQGSLRIVVSDRARVPFSTAIWGGPHVVLPVFLLQNADDLRIVLRHELQHYRNGDPRWAIGLELLRLLFFWHPAAHLWVRDLMHLQELACDEALVRRGTPVRAYGTCLIRVAAMAVEDRMVVSTAMATASERAANFARRIDMLFDHARKNDSRRSRKAACIVSAALVTLVALVTAINWPTAADLPRDVADPAAVARVRTLALANDVVVVSVVANAETAVAIVQLDGSLDAVNELVQAMALEPNLGISQLQLDKQASGAGNGQVLATLVLDDSPFGSGIVDVFDDGMELLRQDRISTLKLERDADRATIYFRGESEDCVTEFTTADCDDLSFGTTTVRVEDYDGDGDQDLFVADLAFGSQRGEAPDLEFENLDGTKVRLSHLEGKVVLLDFWAAWCRPCLDELPYLKQLDRELGGSDFEILGVSLNRDRDELNKFVAENSVPWAQLHTDNGMQSPAAQAFGVKNLPSHVLIDREGRFSHVPLGNPQALVQAVRILIAER